MNYEVHQTRLMWISLGLMSLSCVSAILLIRNVFAENDIIGTQNSAKSPLGNLTLCHGNIIYPSTICVGTDHNDTIIGALGGGTIFGNSGDDKIQGLLGSGVIFGMKGNDAIRGGNTSDTLFGNDGDDVLVAGPGANLLTGGGGSMLSGGKGNDLLIGGGSHDVLIGGPGHDKFQCDGESDLVLDFNPKDDMVSGSCIFPLAT